MGLGCVTKRRAVSLRVPYMRQDTRDRRKDSFLSLTYIHEWMYDPAKNSRPRHIFVDRTEMSYRFIATCLAAWVGVCASAGWLVERLWS
ncbi:conserved protein of unknown function [Cupriavidus taiwanensis]|nr:conserved protein of unknown function [Cupriavidus taiwanensis]